MYMLKTARKMTGRPPSYAEAKKNEVVHAYSCLSSYLMELLSEQCLFIYFEQEFTCDVSHLLSHHYYQQCTYSLLSCYHCRRLVINCLCHNCRHSHVYLHYHNCCHDFNAIFVSIATGPPSWAAPVP